MSDGLRFVTVTLLGVVLDIAIAFVLAAYYGVPLWLAATIGFVVAASVNYVLHQLWSFQASSRRLSVERAAKYAGVALATLLVRITVVALLDGVLRDGFTLLILICGAGTSFLVNFTLSKFFVFTEAARSSDAAP